MIKKVGEVKMNFDVKLPKMGIKLERKPSKFSFKCKKRVIVDLEKREWPEIEVE
ncbi:MAG: hypothetical protein LUQ42_05515 [Methanomicrobiales archaeon]|nr:hypothetical protein [Methanomicrobiales archaeon]